MNSKVKVKTADLLAAVRERRDAEVKAHERALAKYERECAAHGERVVKALEGALVKARAGDYPATDTNWRDNAYLVVPISGEASKKPVLNTSKIDRLIATLEMAADESIAISADDAAAYLG
jgi:hypothetical protein